MVVINTPTKDAFCFGGEMVFKFFQNRIKPIVAKAKIRILPPIKKASRIPCGRNLENLTVPSFNWEKLPSRLLYRRKNKMTKGTISNGIRYFGCLIAELRNFGKAKYSMA
jgi:hypothetical protein